MDTSFWIGILVLVIAGALCVWRVPRGVRLFKRYGARSRRIKADMQQAASDEIYADRLRERRCHRLCLLPFVNEQNVEGVYTRLFHKPRHVKEEAPRDNFWHVLAPALLGMCLCAVCLCGMSWAWFSASTENVVQTIRPSEYRLAIRVTDGDGQTVDGQTTDDHTEYTLTGGTYTVTMTATGSDKAVGYGIIAFGGESRYTVPIFAQGSFTCTITTTGGMLTLTPRWGSCAVTDAENTVSDGAALTFPVGDDTPARADTSPTQPEDAPTTTSAEERTTTTSAATTVTTKGTTTTTTTTTTAPTTTDTTAAPTTVPAGTTGDGETSAPTTATSGETAGMTASTVPHVTAP